MTAKTEFISVSYKTDPESHFDKLSVKVQGKK